MFSAKVTFLKSAKGTSYIAPVKRENEKTLVQVPLVCFQKATFFGSPLDHKQVHELMDRRRIETLLVPEQVQDRGDLLFG
jgi:hypothetical protein